MNLSKICERITKMLCESINFEKFQQSVGCQETQRGGAMGCGQDDSNITVVIIFINFSDFSRKKVFFKN